MWNFDPHSPPKRVNADWNREVLLLSSVPFYFQLQQPSFEFEQHPFQCRLHSGKSSPGVHWLLTSAETFGRAFKQFAQGLELQFVSWSNLKNKQVNHPQNCFASISFGVGNSEVIGWKAGSPLHWLPESVEFFTRSRWSEQVQLLQLISAAVYRSRQGAACKARIGWWLCWFCCWRWSWFWKSLWCCWRSWWWWWWYQENAISSTLKWLFTGAATKLRLNRLIWLLTQIKAVACRRSQQSFNHSVRSLSIDIFQSAKRLSA